MCRINKKIKIMKKFIKLLERLHSQFLQLYPNLTKHMKK